MAIIEWTDQLFVRSIILLCVSQFFQPSFSPQLINLTFSVLQLQINSELRNILYDLGYMIYSYKASSEFFIIEYTTEIFLYCTNSAIFFYFFHVVEQSYA